MPVTGLGGTLPSAVGHEPLTHRNSSPAIGRILAVHDALQRPESHEGLRQLPRDPRGALMVNRHLKSNIRPELPPRPELGECGIGERLAPDVGEDHRPGPWNSRLFLA